ncbi:MAG: ABC transporter substrate-binding protein [Novosphingobium sp.]|nr:ABC transporter substrate-binding protein [Novosphingobium sp.]
MKAGTLLASACLALAGCVPASGGQGGIAGGDRPAVVSLNPCADAILAEVADPGQVLAISHYSHDPRASSMPLAEARRFRATGGTVEEVMALQPDVVIAGTFLPPATRAAFERMGMKVETFAIEHSVAESLAQVRHVAALTGHPERGEALVARIERALVQAAPPPGSRAISTVMWQSGGIVPGRDALVSDLMQRTGFASHSAARGLRQADYLPLEEMLSDPPQLILTAGTPGDGEDRMLTHPALDALAGTRRARFDRGLLYCGGPTIVRAAGRLAQVRGEMGT